jgi:very-short-patch-repair endonuclease
MRTKDLPTHAFAQSQRKSMSDAEKSLWRKLRGRRFAGHKFIRQFSIGPYFADFCCRKAMLIVEADGSQHSQSEYDARRDAYLVEQGYRVLRFWNGDILTDGEMIDDTIIAALEGQLEPYERYKVKM